VLTALESCTFTTILEGSCFPTDKKKVVLTRPDSMKTDADALRQSFKGQSHEIDWSQWSVIGMMDISRLSEVPDVGC